MKHLRMAAFSAAIALGSGLPAFAEPAHKVAIHLDENDPKKMNMVLNNAKNIATYFTDKGEEVAIEIVTYGPGLHMLREDTSPVKDRIASMELEVADITFSACLNTVTAMKQKVRKDIPLIDEARLVPSGAARLMELQEQGYSYLRP